MADSKKIPGKGVLAQKRERFPNESNKALAAGRAKIQGPAHALDQLLPPEYSEVVSTGSNNDSALLKKFRMLENAKLGNAEVVSRRIREAFVETPN